MLQLRYNEVKDLLEMNEILFTEKEYNSISMQLPELGECTYWAKKDRLHIHKPNKWLYDGFYNIRRILNGEKKNGIELEHEYRE